MLTLTEIAAVCGSLSTIAAFIILFIKPIRERVMGTRAIMDGLRCQLRGDMLRTYYRNHERDAIRQYEFENFVLAYKAYKALGGNSFIDHIFTEVQKWEIES